MKTNQLIAIVLVLSMLGASLPAFAEEPEKLAVGGHVRCVSADKELFSACLAAARALVARPNIAELQAPVSPKSAATVTTPVPEAGTPAWVWPVVGSVSLVAIVGGGLAIFFATRTPEVRVHYDAPAGQ